MTSEDENEDPFDFDKKKDDRPQLFKNLSAKRQSFGDIKFFLQSTPTTSAAIEDEPIRQLVPALTNKTPLQAFRTSTTPKRERKTSSTPKEGRKTPSTPKSRSKTPTRKRKSSKDSETPMKVPKLDFDDDSAVSPVKGSSTRSNRKALPKIKEEMPSLTAEEQVLADDEANAHYPKGARVYGIWGKEYYSAIIDDSDGLGRCKLFYTEDLSVRTIPRAGVIPIHLIKEGSEVGVIGEEIDGEKAAYEGKVLSIPSIKNTDEWHRGLFTIEITKEDEEVESRQVEWFDIYFTEAQYKHNIKNVKNPTAVDQDNVIEGSGRRTRRSTASVATPTTTTTPRAKPGPKPKKKLEEVADETTATPETEEPQKEEAPAKLFV